MTTHTEAMRRALDRLDAALRGVEPYIMTIAVDDMAAAKREAAALRAALAAAPQPARVAYEVPALDWPAMLLLLNEYAMHVHDASEHQAESRADISKTAALKTLERIRMALAAHNSRWQALVHELIWRATPAAQDPARVALPADLIEYMRKHLQRERHGLDGFTVLGNETARAERYDRWISALLAAGIPGTDGGADHG